MTVASQKATTIKSKASPTNSAKQSDGTVHPTITVQFTKRGEIGIELDADRRCAASLGIDQVISAIIEAASEDAITDAPDGLTD